MRMAPSRRLRAAARHLGCNNVLLGSEETDPPLGSLDGMQPPLRCFTTAELGTSAAAAGDDVAPVRAWPDKLPDDHPAVLQFKRLGYVVITDAVAPGPLRWATEVFHSKQEAARQIREVGRHLQQVRPGHSPDEPSEQYFDLPREDIGIVPEAFNTGAHGGFLVTQDAADFSAYMEILANPQVLPLLLALVGPAMHLEEVGARTVEAPPLEQALKYGGYTEWHRDAGGRSASAVAASPPSTALAPQRLPIGSVGCDYNRVKCFAMLTDVDAAGGHLMWGSPPDQYQGGNMDNMPGHVKVTVPAGGMALFDQRCWHTGMPLTNGQNRESFIFTYAGPLPVSSNCASKRTTERRRSRWPVGSYGGGPTEPSGYNKNFLQCGKEIDALGYCDSNPLHRQLLGLELTHPAATPTSASTGADNAQADDDHARRELSSPSFPYSIGDALVVRVEEQMLRHPQEYLEEIQYDVDEL